MEHIPWTQGLYLGPFITWGTIFPWAAPWSISSFNDGWAHGVSHGLSSERRVPLKARHPPSQTRPLSEEQEGSTRQENRSKAKQKHFRGCRTSLQYKQHRHRFCLLQPALVSCYPGCRSLPALVNRGLPTTAPSPLPITLDITRA